DARCATARGALGGIPPVRRGVALARGKPMSGVTRAHVERFRDVIGTRLGLQFDEGKLHRLADVLHRRLAQSGTASVEDYLARLLAPSPDFGELRALAPELTVGETYFFRNPDHFRALVELVVPDRMRARARERTLRILSAGCASGEEAYTIA